MRGLGVEPLLERRAGEGGVPAGQEGTVLEELVVRIVRVAHLLDAERLAAPGDEQSRDLDEPLLPRAADLRDGCAVGSRHARRDGGQVGDGFGDIPGGHELGAHARHVDHVALPAPLHHLRNELVKLCCAQDSHRDRPRGHRLLVRGLRCEKTTREPVGSDDRNQHDSLHAGLLADLLQVARRCREELRGRVLLGQGLRSCIDDALHPGESLCKPLPGDHVHPARS